MSSALVQAITGAMCAENLLSSILRSVKLHSRVGCSLSVDEIIYRYVHTPPHPVIVERLQQGCALYHFIVDYFPKGAVIKPFLRYGGRFFYFETGFWGRDIIRLSCSVVITKIIVED